MIAKVLILVWLFILLLVFPGTILASQPHYTLIINQVRGEECCDVGSLINLNFQLAALAKNSLPATFAVRFDALTDPKYTQVLKNKSDIEIAGMLEIIPSLATASGVVYKSTPEKWYEPSSSFLVGYSQDERKKLIDTYLAKFKSVFGHYPTTTVAWMIDTYSLEYIRQKYGIMTHEITREQWNTDAITLYGGPPHYPYYPSPNWAVVPVASASSNMPLVLRQTIADPVKNYGDDTNSHTSQPNDYFTGKRDINYFVHLFTQAHSQEINPYTFAILGLENSMPNDVQREFSRQLDYVGNWVREGQNNYVVLAKDFSAGFTTTEVVLYWGSSFEDPSLKVWWVTTPKYRVRIRQDQGKLYISDWRIYNDSFIDPYFEKQSGSRAYWIVPFIFDGSRLRQGDSDVTALFNPQEDSFSTSLLLAQNLTKDEVELQRDEQGLVLKRHEKELIKFSKDFLLIPGNLNWQNPSENSSWGLQQERIGNWLKLTPWAKDTNLSTERQNQPAFLLPSLLSSDPDPKKTIIYVNNRYSIAGRNPIRILLLPKNVSGYPVAVINKLEATTNPAVTNITYSEPDQNSGGIFIDVTKDIPGKVEVKIKIPNLEKKEEVFFAPDCRKAIGSCLTNPTYLYWYGRNFLQEVYNKFK